MNSVVLTGGAMLAEQIQPIQSAVPTIDLTTIDFVKLLGKQGLKYMTNATKMSLVTSAKAMEDAGITSVDPVRSGIVVGTNLASVNTITQFDLVSLTEGVDCVSPMQGPNCLLNAPAARLGIHHQISGFNTTISSGRVAAFDALEYAYNAIQIGEVDICLVVAVEESSDEYKNYFADAELNDITLDKLCQSASALILESEDHARRRGAKILGKIYGFQSIFEPGFLLADEFALENGYRALAMKYHDIRQLCVAASEMSIAEDERVMLEKCFNCSTIINSGCYIASELYSVSGMAQVIYALSTKEERLSVLINHDWFGNFRSVLLEREGSNDV